jgi:hypothetical protein
LNLNSNATQTELGIETTMIDDSNRIGPIAIGGIGVLELEAGSELSSARMNLAKASKKATI